MLVRGGLGGGGEVCVGGVELEELSGGTERLERARGRAGGAL